MSEKLSNWLVGKGLLNGGDKAKPEIVGLLSRLDVEITSVSKSQGGDILQISADEETMIGLKELLRANMHA